MTASGKRRSPRYLFQGLRRDGARRAALAVTIPLLTAVTNYTTLAPVDRNRSAKDYFDACRAARAAIITWRVACRRARTAWRNLRIQYQSALPANASIGQQNSLAEATRKENVAQTRLVTARGHEAAMNNNLRTALIYPNQPLGGKVLENHIPEERHRNGVGAAVIAGMTFAADGIPGAIWRASPQAGTLGGGNSDPRVWYRVDAANNIIEVRMGAPVVAMSCTNGMRCLEVGEKGTSGGQPP